MMARENIISPRCILFVLDWTIVSISSMRVNGDQSIVMSRVQRDKPSSFIQIRVGENVVTIFCFSCKNASIVYMTKKKLVSKRTSFQSNILQFTKIFNVSKELRAFTVLQVGMRLSLKKLSKVR